MDALVLAALLSHPMLAEPVKCGGLPNTFAGYEADAPVVVVDDRVVPASEGLEEIRELDVGYLDVTCWNPETGEFGVPPGIPVVRVITKSEYRDVVAPALAAVRAQAEAYGSTGRYIENLTDLRLEGTEGLDLRLDVDGSGWSLVIEARFQRCEVSDELTGEITRGVLERSACGLRSDEQSGVLRRAYEAPRVDPNPEGGRRIPADLTHLGASSGIAVYSAVLQAIRQEMSATSRLLVDPLVREIAEDAPLLEKIPRENGLATSFVEANRGATGLLPSEAEALDVDLFDRERTRGSDGGGPGDFWQRVRREYGAGTSIVQFTRPGFTTDGNTAVIYYGWACGGRCGQTRVAVLSRESGRWKIIRDELMMIS